MAVSYTHLDVYKRQALDTVRDSTANTTYTNNNKIVIYN